MRLTSDQALALRVAELLLRFGFDETGLAHPPAADDPKGLLASLFLQAAPHDRERALELLGADGFELLVEAGLLRLEEGRCRANVLLYPLHGLLIASDFPRSGTEDFVFPAISGQTHEYLSILPSTPCERLLEVGTGSGAAALLAAEYADRVIATDVSRRCLEFAEFNRLLNGLENVEIVRSDVYDDISARFDRIIAHPPYVPWTGEQEIYRHGGPDGEAVLRRLVAGLPKFLAPGGRCYLSAMGADTAEATLEQRLRRMLGESEREFDVLLVERETIKPIEFILPWSEGEEISFEEAWRLHEAFRERGVRRLVRCSIVLSHRLSGSSRTLRRKAGAATFSVDLEAVIDGPAFPAFDWSDRLRIRSDVKLEEIRVVAGAGWQTANRVLDAPGPFAFRTDCPDWAAEALPLLDGRRTIRDVVAANVDVDEAEAFLGCLLDAGVLSVVRDP